MSIHLNRRGFMAGAAALIAGGSVRSRAEDVVSPIASIEVETLKRGRTGGEPTWFHSRVCMIPGSPPTAFMTLQTIAGSDYYGPVHFMTSTDLGKTWSDPQPVPALGQPRQPNGAVEAVCDVVPEWHAPTSSVLAVGHNVFYSGPKFSADQPPRCSVYAVWKSGQWGPRRTLDWPDPRGALIYTNGCGQRVTAENGDILLALSFTAEKKQPRAVASAWCGFNGEDLAIKKMGPELTHPHGRGLLEPSLVQFEQRYFMTLRAEDQRGYVCTSDDGLNWSPKEAWAWDNGEPLVMSTTQQHWLASPRGLFLVYNRQHPSNLRVFRWRSPLFIAQVNTKRLRLLRATERIVIPLAGDGLMAPDEVRYGGNFHPVSVNDQEAWVTDGQVLPKRGYQGDLLLARIRWPK